MKTATYKIEGVAPLYMHNGQLADPLNKWAKLLKELSSKRKKTDADHEEMSRIEFLGGLYLDGDGHPCIPGECIESMLINGAKAQKLGAHFKRFVFCPDASCKLKYSGPKTAEGLWQDERFVSRVGARVGTARVMRTRPYFERWAVEFPVVYDELNKNDIDSAVVEAGRSIGLMDWRPKYGRFNVVEE